MHFVHQTKMGDMAVVSFLFQLGPTNNTKLTSILNTVESDIRLNCKYMYCIK